MVHRIPIDGTLDLHTFRPSEAASVVDEYLEACYQAGLPAARIVHGKGSGAMKRTVEAIIRRHPRVESYQVADELAGGWGATLVTLKRPSEPT